jgi:hypothetical protein
VLTCARDVDEELVHDDEGRLHCVVHVHRPVERVCQWVEHSMQMLLCLDAFGTDLSTFIQFLNCWLLGALEPGPSFGMILEGDLLCRNEGHCRSGGSASWVIASQEEEHKIFVKAKGSLEEHFMLIDEAIDELAAHAFIFPASSFGCLSSSASLPPAPPDSNLFACDSCSWNRHHNQDTEADIIIGILKPTS